MTRFSQADDKSRTLDGRGLVIIMAILLAFGMLTGATLVQSTSAHAAVNVSAAKKVVKKASKKNLNKRVESKKAAAQRAAAAKRAAKKQARAEAAARKAAAASPTTPPVAPVAPPTVPVGLPTSNFTDGNVFGDWRVVFAGYGTVGSYTTDDQALYLAPMAVSDANATSAALAVSTQDFTAGNLQVSSRMTTTQQLRQNSAANAWEVPWLVWDYSDNEHFYYAVAKPNGWELGKRDPAYPGGQRFLATGSNPAVSVGQAADLNVVRQAGNGVSTMTLTINNSVVAQFNDRERPYTSGNVGAYTEDAAVVFANVVVNGQALRTR